MSSPAPPPPVPAKPPAPSAPPPPAVAAPPPVSATPISVQPPHPIQPKPPPPQQQQLQAAGPASGPPPQLLNLVGPQPPVYRGPICWNSYCKDPDPNSFGRRGWKVRSGPPFSVYADLCGRCYSQFEQGIYCETFHSEEGGWRNCETCGRRVHCGCIVSIHKYQLRDAGGVDCNKCARNTRTAMYYPQNVSGYNEFQAQMRNGRPRVDAKARSQLLPRSHSVTPLFEKMLSASDAGRIGRLVLPKKCAEAYFPAISQPEGLPLKVQDISGKEWIFQFRFWPNNNSRMYVLEGVTPCIQSMQLQAGDTVTFSRLDPEGKLVMGFRKATNLSTEQDQTTKPANGAPTSSEANGKVPAPDSSPNAAVARQNKVNIESNNSSPVEQATAKMDKGGSAQKESPGPGQSSPGAVKRKATSVGQKIKRLRMDNEESMELKITWEEAQELLRPPPKAPSIVVVDGHEFEEYEEPPILGRKTYFVTDQSGANLNQQSRPNINNLQPVYKSLPRVPDFIIIITVQLINGPSVRTVPNGGNCQLMCLCPLNGPVPTTNGIQKGDLLLLSSCERAQEMSMEELAELIPIKSGLTGAKKSKGKMDVDTIDASDGLDTLANLAILGEGEAIPSQPTTKHPRHRPGCSCIVCIQPPSGKGPKHKQTCTCNVCMTVRRRFRTLMLRREKRKDTDSPRKKEAGQSSQTVSQSGSGPVATTASISPQKTDGNADGPEDMAVDHKMTSSPVKNHIDLNIQPDRDDEQSPKADAAGATRLLRDNPT
ncbi:hypothetical protein PR202_ga29550 [Eleusine coracana subsp. coracana]|uniref:TF-B3 domain-containing protein n=1 Tax=Eleusine coracana subsp. coracana TaxID=191504 RepID=A0AAV5DL41_ELECO|nr:hypothetical protein PR202_ga29550 [Eleusine coracana subsp. coracana]